MKSRFPAAKPAVRNINGGIAELFAPQFHRVGKTVCTKADGFHVGRVHLVFQKVGTDLFRPPAVFRRYRKGIAERFVKTSTDAIRHAVRRKIGVHVAVHADGHFSSSVFHFDGKIALFYRSCDRHEAFRNEIVSGVHRKFFVRDDLRHTNDDFRDRRRNFSPQICRDLFFFPVGDGGVADIVENRFARKRIQRDPRQFRAGKTFRKPPHRGEIFFTFFRLCRQDFRFPLKILFPRRKMAPCDRSRPF